MIKTALANLYFLLTLFLLPFGYNCLYLVYCSRKYTPRIQLQSNHKPVVSIQLPIYNERYVFPRLIESITSLDWPKDRMQIQILDDSSDDTTEIVTDLTKRYIVEGYNIQVLRREERTGFKAGALQNALQYSEGEYIAVFDADFTPPSDFLHATIPILENSPKLGILQTRWGHINRGYNKLTQAFALGIDGHHIVEQTGRSANGLLLNFNGSCGVLRKEAILDAGGWASDTLSEDMDLSYRIQLKGWKAQYTKEVTVPGEVPPNIPAFRSQQARWAKGSIQCSKKILPRLWKSNEFSLPQKIQATFHLSYYSIHPIMLLTLMVSVPLIAFDAAGLIPYGLPLVLMFSFCVVSSFSMYFTAIREQNMSLKEKIPYLGLLSIIGYGLSARCALSVISGLLNPGGFFNRTPKYDIKTKDDRWRDKIYSPLTNLSMLEIFFLLYTVVGIYLSFTHHLWSFLFYLSVYLMGFFTIVYYMT